MDFFQITNSIIILFIMIAIGYASFRMKVIDRQGAKGLSSFLVNISFPCLIIVSMQIPLTGETFGSTLEMFGIAAVYYLISFAFAFLVPRFLSKDEHEVGVMKFMLVFSNLGFMGIPVTAAIFGIEAVFYTSLVMLPFGFLVFSAGILMLRPDMGKSLDPKLFLNSGIISSLIGLVFFFTGFSIPAPFIDVLEILGELTTPLAMVVVGALLATLPISGMFDDLRIYFISFLRLIAIPFAVYLVLTPFVTDKLFVGIAVLLASMPVAANSVLLAEEYDVDSTLASKGVFISTIFSIVTIPVIAVLLISV
jgi:malate permease and related proteins